MLPQIIFYISFYIIGVVLGSFFTLATYIESARKIGGTRYADTERRAKTASLIIDVKIAVESM